MMYLGSNPVGVTQKDFLGHGTITPNEDTTTFTIDTGSTGWNHFLLKVNSLPYSTQPSRGFCLVYVDIAGNYETWVFGASSGQSYPANVNTLVLGTYTTINNGIITKSGIAASSGKLIANTTYEWWCW